MPLAFVGLGANVGDASARLRWAAHELEAFGRVRLSSLYTTAPVGPVVDQPWFLNAVCALETDLAPRALLTELLAIEARAGRDRARELAQGPRPLDLDLLLYDGLVLAEPDGSLVELGGHGLTIPGRGRCADLLAAVIAAQPIAKVT